MDVLPGNNGDGAYTLVVQDGNYEGFVAALKSTNTPYTTINVFEFKELDEAVKKIIVASHILTGNLVVKNKYGLETLDKKWKFPFLIRGRTVIAHGQLDRRSVERLIEAYK